MDVESLHTDGNAIGGLLREVFAMEVTAAERRCPSCGRESAVGAHRLFRGAGLVLRCPGCDAVGAVIAVLPDRNVISLQGTWSLPPTSR